MSNNYIEYESKDDKNKTLSVEKYLNKIRPYLKDIISNLKKPETWKIQLTRAVNFISSKDDDEERLMHSRNDKKEIMINDQADKIFNSFLNRYQNNLEKLMKGVIFSLIMFIYCIIKAIK